MDRNLPRSLVKRSGWFLAYLSLLAAPIAIWGGIAQWLLMQVRYLHEGEPILPRTLWAPPPDTLRPVILEPDTLLPSLLILTTADPACGACGRLLAYFKMLHERAPGLIKDSARVFVVFLPSSHEDPEVIQAWKSIGHEVAYDRQGYFPSRMVRVLPAILFILPYGYLYAWKMGNFDIKEVGQATLTFIRAVHVYGEYLEKDLEKRSGVFP